MSQRKLRLIKSKQDNATAAYGITIPPEIADFFKEVYFTVEQNGNNIILISGAHLKQVVKQNAITLEDYKV